MQYIFATQKKSHTVLWAKYITRFQFSLAFALETLAACLGLGPPSSGHWGRRPSFIGQLWKWGRGGGEQVTAPELGNEAQNEGLAASGRCPWLLAWLPCSSSGHVNKSRITQGDSSDPCETPLGANVSVSHAPLLPFGTISDISEEPLSSPNIQMLKERLFFFSGLLCGERNFKFSNCQILFRDMSLMK